MCESVCDTGPCRTAGAHTKFFTGGSFTTDFLTWLVRDTGKVSLEEAHYHLSYLPAQAAGFTDRGYLPRGGAGRRDRLRFSRI